VRLTKYRLLGIAAIALVGVVVVLVAIGVATKNRENTYTARVDFETLIRSQMKELYDGWIIVVVERGDALTKGFQRVLAEENISATVLRSGIPISIDKLSKKPQMIVFNLLDGEVLEEVKSPGTADTLRRLVREGVYVFFVANDSNVIREISTLFDPSLSYSTSSEATITKAYSGGKQELLVVGTLFAVGRTYRNVDGKLVPVDGGTTILLDKPTTTDEAVQRLAHELMKSIVAGENSLHRRWG